MKDILWFAKALFIAFDIVAIVGLTIDWSLHHNDYKVASDELTFISGNLVGDVLCVTNQGDTVFVYGSKDHLVFGLKTDTPWQTRHDCLDFVGFTTDSVVVKPWHR